ncbi:MAG: TonB-dependent receptor [Chitinophagaceae bacterium]
MKIKHWTISFLLSTATPLLVAAQEKTSAVINSELSGHIVDQSTKTPLEGVSIVIKGTTNQTVTDDKGNFHLRTGQKFPYTLQVSFVGYKSIEVKVDGSPVNIELNATNQSLSDVVVVGYGTQKRKDLTGAIVSVPKGSLQQTTSSLDNTLGGAVTGVQVTQSSGQPGASSSVRIRGGNSITGSNEPLYVIDGLIVYNDNSSASAGSSYTGAGLNVLSTINPADIESVEVLKDASATAIYGSRGANGVIIVNTVKGSKSKDVVSYQGTLGWQEIRKKLDLLDASQWASLRNDINTSLGTAASYTDAQIEALGKGTDWQSAALRKGLVQNHQITVNGGDNRTRYALSGNYFSQDGILLNTGFKRYSGRVNLERNVSNSFKVGVNVIGARVEQNGVTATSSGNLAPNTWVLILEGVPTDSIYTADGSYNYALQYSPGLTNGITPNPIADLTNTINKTASNRVLGNFFAEYKILDGLVAKLNTGADLLNTKQNFYAPYRTSVGLANGGLGQVGTVNVNSWQAEFTVNYNKTINEDHSINVLAGYTTQKSNGQLARATATNFPSDLTTFNSLQSGTPGTPYSDAYKTVLNSYLGRVNYSYLHRYNLTASLRADGSSRFEASNRWGYFPSVGFSWNVGDEPWLQRATSVSNLKLRASYGRTGNQEIGNYQFLSLLSPFNYSFNGTVVTGFAPQNLANANLTWEKTDQLNVGVDLGLWKNTVNLTVDYYDKKTSDLLLNVPIETTYGYSSFLQNIGAVRNRGLEIALNVQALNGGLNGFNWNTAVNFSLNRNKVLSLAEGLDQFSPTLPSGTLQVLNPVLVKVGESLGTFYGYQTDGIVQTGDDVSSIAKPSWITGTYQAGDRKYVDRDGNGVVNSDDRTILGNAQPKFIYGFTNTFSYKGFDLFVLLQGSYGNKIYNALKQQLEITTLSTNVLATEADRWTTTNPSNDIPRATSSPVAVVMDRNVQSGSYARIKTLTLGYNFPVQIGGGKTVAFRVFATGQNLFTWTHYSGYDPEVNTFEQTSLYQGIDYGAYPSARNYNFGLKVTF